MIPVAFLLGFYVTLVVQRWWDQFELFAWIDSLSFLVSIYIIGDGLEERLIRKTILRYVNLGATMTLIEKSPLIAKRFPTLNHLIDFGLLTVDEMMIIEAVQSDPPHPKYAIPYIWAGKVVDKALVSNMLADDGCREWPSCVHDTNNGLKDPVVLNQLYKKEPATMFANIIVEKLDVTSLDNEN
ncbi:ATP-dependent RNA helicase DHX36 [Armadillidium vulgare]|nr:ATP-dependent RNA helicase DHX36 [Armadillidium vulgare]